MKKIIARLAVGAVLVGSAAVITAAPASAAGVRVGVGIGIGVPGYYGAPYYNNFSCDPYSRYYDPYRCGAGYYGYGYGPSFYIGSGSRYYGGGYYRGGYAAVRGGGSVRHGARRLRRPFQRRHPSPLKADLRKAKGSGCSRSLLFWWNSRQIVYGHSLPRHHWCPVHAPAAIKGLGRFSTVSRPARREPG